jgi:hypothetical protein
MPEFDWLLIAVEAFFAVCSSPHRTTGWAARVLLGLRSLGSWLATARPPDSRSLDGAVRARPRRRLTLRIAFFGGDLFRSGSSDEGTTGYVLNAWTRFSLPGLLWQSSGCTVEGGRGAIGVRGSLRGNAVRLLLAAAIFA